MDKNYKKRLGKFQDILLYEISKIAGKRIVFRGGAAISRFYNSGRFSKDLDFVMRSKKDFSLDYVKHVFDRIIKNNKVFSYAKEPEKNKFGTLKLFLNAKDKQGKIKMEIGFQRQASLLNNARILKRDWPKKYAIGVMHEKEILAEKVRAIMSERKSKKGRKENDLYDLYSLIKNEVEIDKELIRKKLDENKILFNRALFDENLGRIKKNWKALIPALKRELKDYDHVKKTVIEKLKEEKVFSS